MKRELWQRAEVLFHAAVEQGPDARRAFLDEACRGDAELRREVELLVSHDEQAGSFLDQPAISQLGTDGALAGRQLGSYKILSLLGEGGMGEVYLAHDLKLGRNVAIKTLPQGLAGDPERLARLRREARTLASLNHPNIEAIYGLEEAEDVDYLVLELVEGDRLQGPLPLSTALDYARQVAEALEAAHCHEIVHRDLKPANVKVTCEGRIKVLDFGLARTIGASGRPEGGGPEDAAASAASVTGNVAGTPGYMSPEQARGGAVDQRTDIWAFGCLLYELLTGKRAFTGETASGITAAVLGAEPDWRMLPAGTPAKIRELLSLCLQKDTNGRLSRIIEARIAIEKVQRELGRSRSFATKALTPWVPILAAAILLSLCIFAARLYQQQTQVRWVRENAIPEISRAIAASDFKRAFQLVRRAKAVLPQDPALKQLIHNSALPTSFTTNPPGVDVWVTGYAPQDEDWMRLGVTPFTTRELTWGYYRFRLAKPGFRTIHGTGEVRGGTSITFDLDAEGTIPDEMVRVPGGTAVVTSVAPVRLDAFLIDRYETTNRQFKDFVDRGGYQRPEYWKVDFVRGGRKLSWQEAMLSFRDPTGRAAPSTWYLGKYPPGQDNYPVHGVSWYEAAAFAEYAGKQLPTVYHWQRAAAPGFYADIAELSNFGTGGPASIGTYRGLGAFGTLDMAGNVREWCWNESDGRRYIRGGAWNDAAYLFSDPDARDPWDRSAQNGFRCVRYDVGREPGLREPVSARFRDLSREHPPSDDTFRLYTGLYAYDSTDLDARAEGIDEETEYWKRERVSFAAAYGNERVGGYLYLPKNARPPYQTLIYAHPGMAYRLPAPVRGEEFMFDFLVRSGRAFLMPVLQGQYHRRYPALPGGPNGWRDLLILESKDFRRSIDYLVSRPDVNRDRLGVFGISFGGSFVPVLAAGEHRLKACALVSAGLPTAPMGLLPEVDPFHFVSRFKVPTLMVNGGTDFVVPYETAARPMFRLLGTADSDKRLFVVQGGHAQSNTQPAIKEILDWFDRYLGPAR